MKIKKVLLLLIAVVLLLTIFLALRYNSKIISLVSKPHCDDVKILQIVKEQNFIPEYDTLVFSAENFNKLSEEENERLWYRDVESPDTTLCTRYWDDYSINSFYSSPKRFINQYDDKPNIEIAFQFGPYIFDLMAYNIFIIRKVDECFLITRSYYRHSRFVYKAYAILEERQIDNLYRVLDPITKMAVDSSIGYSGVFVDNRNSIQYYIDFQKGMTETDNNSKEKGFITNLFDFIDNKIEWRETYNLFRN